MLTKEKYNSWNHLKQNMNFIKMENKYPKAWEIWNIYNWLNMGYESIWKWNDFESPVLVMKKMGSMFLCITMTTKWKDNNKYYFSMDNSYFNKKSYLTLSQWKCMDNKSFIKSMWQLSNNDLFEIKKELKHIWF